MQSKRLLEDITGAPVRGYRAPSFSISEEVLQVVRECGYDYDSSFNSFKGNSRYGRLELSRNGTGVACKVSQNFY